MPDTLSMAHPRIARVPETVLPAFGQSMNTLGGVLSAVPETTIVTLAEPVLVGLSCPSPRP